MKFSLDPQDSGPIIQGYGPGEIKISGQIYRHSLVVTPDHVFTDWPVEKLEDLTASHLEQLIGFEPQIILLGTGETHRFPATPTLLGLISAGIGYEIMSTAAACRTFAVLNSEGRKVVAGLIL